MDSLNELFCLIDDFYKEFRCYALPQRKYAG